MKLTVTVLLAVVAVVSAVDVEPVQIVRSDYHQQPDGSYDFGFETANGIVRTETGEVKEALDEENKPHQVVVVRGSYSYTDAEGKPETVNYVADEKGFQPEGDSIPKPAAGR